MRRLISILLLLLTTLYVHAQSLAVQSFRLDEADLTANTAGTIVMDQNGQKCALIKVETTQQGFTFDTGSLGVVKTEQKVGEIWVYVPEGVKRLTISHQQLGMLRDYDLGQTLKRAKTYVMKLTSGEVQTIVTQARTSQYVVFQLQPENAVVMLDNEMLQTTGGTATKMMKFGTYDYRVQAPDYLPEVGKVTVNDPKNKHVVNVSLKPNFSTVTLTVEGNAEIWVNGEQKGTGQWTGNLSAGTYEFETRKASHRSATTTRDIAAASQPLTIQLNAPTPIYGEADINSAPAMADIYVDGNKVGQTPQVLSELLIGEHKVRLSRQGYADYNGSITIREGETTPLSATLEETSKQATTTTTSSGSSETITANGVSFKMIRVEGGTFTMGATSEQGADAYGNEKPAHNVTLSSYYIGETEVTQELWQAVMGSNHSDFMSSKHPVEGVSWNDCQTFISKLNSITGKTFRLPTEAEWEYSARGGSKSQNYTYSGSNTIDDVAWYTENGSSKTHEVATKAPNELGIYDMSGNVWEWCQDWYGSDYYSSSPSNNPTGPSSGSSRVKRGGSWSNSATGCRVSHRDNSNPASAYYYLGLRLAL